MSASFVTELRSRPGTLRVGGGQPTMTVRVQSPEVWDAVAIETTPETRIADVKRAAATALLGTKVRSDDLVLKLRGFEVLNENATLAQTGAIDGSIFLATHRRRRPVR